MYDYHRLSPIITELPYDCHTRVFGVTATYLKIVNRWSSSNINADQMRSTVMGDLILVVTAVMAGVTGAFRNMFLISYDLSDPHKTA